MKTQKLIVIASIVCLLVGVSGIAMAEPSNCEFGWIANETVDSINIEGQNCYISDVVVEGDITAKNGGELVMRKSRVFGSVQTEDMKSVALFDNKIVGGSVLVIRPDLAYLAFNELTRTGQQQGLMGMLIQGVGVNNLNTETGEPMGEAFIFDNDVRRGVIQCIDTGDLAFAQRNIAKDINCPGQMTELDLF